MLLTEKKKAPLEALERSLEEDLDDEGVAELVIDLRKMLQEYDIVRLILPEAPGENLTTEHGSELVFFQEEPVS